jgi:hypothetical protein
VTLSHHPLDDAGAAARWGELWERSPQRTPFSTLTYVRALAATLRLGGEIHLVEEGGLDAAGAVALWRRRGPYKEMVLPPVTPFSAFLLRSVPDESSYHDRGSPFEALLGLLQARYDSVRLRLPPQLTDVRPAQWRGWRTRTYYTYHVPLEEGDPVERWTSSARRTFRRGEEMYHAIEDPAAGHLVAHLCSESYARHNRRPPLSQDRLEVLIERLALDRNVRLFVVSPRSGGDPEGGLAVLLDGHIATYWIAGSRPGPAMTVLLGVILRQLQQDGLHVFDFVGANTPSIAEFKRKFGSVLVPYFHLETTSPIVLRALGAIRRMRR